MTLRSIILIVLFCLAGISASDQALSQQAVKTRAGAHADYGRIVFEWPKKTGYSASVNGKELRVVFDKPFKADYAVITRRLGDYVGKPVSADGGKEVRFPLRREFGLATRQFDKIVVIDLLKKPPLVKAEILPPAKPKRKQASSAAVPETDAAAQAPTAKDKSAAETKPQAVAAVVTPKKELQEAPEIKSERSEAEAAADREKAIAFEKEQKRLAEEQAVGAALARAKLAEDEKKEIITPDGPELELRVKEIAGGLRLRFPFQKDQAAAVFVRGEYLWVVFDAPIHVDLSIIPLLKHDVILKGEQLDDQDATVLAFRIVPGFLPRVERRHSVWQIDLLREAVSPEGIFPVLREPEKEPGGLVRVQAGNPRGPVNVIDPFVGDTMIVVPVLEVAQAIVEKRKYVDFELLPTSQGVAVIALSDQLKVSAVPGSVEITATPGLQMSDDIARMLGKSAGTAAMPQPPAFMDLERWRRGTENAFYKTRQQLRANVATSKVADRNNNQMSLAQFYLAYNLAAEARGVLNIMAAEDVNVINDPYYRGLSGVTNYYMGRYVEAEKDLTVNALNNDSHAKLWLAAIKARKNLWSESLSAFDSGLAVLGKYPADIRAQMRILAGTAALALGENDRAERELNNVPIDTLPAGAASEAQYLQARLLEARGKNDEAVDTYDKVIAAHYLPSETPARLSRVLLLSKLGSIDKAQTVDQLETLRYVWRGDDTELKILEALGDSYVADGAYREGLSVMRSAVTYYRGTDRSGRIADKMNETFADLYLRNGSDSMSAIKALALYYDFRELTPLGADGDEMIRRLGERLVTVDLLDEAIELLDHQVRYRLEGTAKAQVAVRLAVIQLLDKQPEQALDTIRRTRQTRLPEDLTFKRLLLEGRALTELSEFEQALELIAGIDNPEANLLRTDIYWAAQDWPMAAASMDKILPQLAADKPVDEATQSRIMRAAIAYALAGQQDGLDRLRARYDAPMAAGKYADSFDVVTRSSSGSGVAFRQLASTIAGIDTLKDFMATYRRDL